MGPRPWVRWSMILWSMTVFLFGAGGAAAQLFEDASRSLDLGPDPIVRSPRLLGMGRLTYVVEDRRNRIDLWDFARSPTGVLDNDSTTTVELTPSTSAASSIYGIPGTLLERQVLAGRQSRFAYEAWHRGAGASAYGLVGDIGMLRADRPFNQEFEQRSNFTNPNVNLIVNGRMPYVWSDRMQYGIRAALGYQTSSDRYRRFVSNGAGQYLDKDGEIGRPPNYFAPDEYSVRTLGGGAALSLRLGQPLTLAVGLDDVGMLIKGTNDGGRYSSQTRENRPFGSVQVSAVGRVGGLSYGADGRGWSSKSHATWVFSLATGPAAVPLAGRGSLLKREEEGRSLRSRLKWTVGPFEVGGGLSMLYRKVTIDAPLPSDSSSFNRFLTRVFYSPAADTVVIPDSVSATVKEDRAWEAGGGIAWKFTRRGVIGTEFHRRQDVSDLTLFAYGFDLLNNRFKIAGPGEHGPKRRGWDVRTGIEYECSPILSVRAGYLHRWDDRDDLTRRNEYLSNGATVGIGVRPKGVRWNIDTGFAAEWERADFGDPGLARGSRHQLAARILWPL